jgi:Concanavalin A-like lectin/glucanases superfamily
MGMIIAAVVVLLVCLAAGYWYYSKSASDSGASSANTLPSIPPPPPPPVGTPAPSAMTTTTTAVTPLLQTLYSSGQKIQDSELEVGLATVPFFSAPFGYTLGQPPAYSMSMDIMIAQQGDRWRNIFEHGPQDGADFPPGQTFRRPAVFVTGGDNPPANRIMVVHSNMSNENSSVTTVNTAPMGKYFTLTWVVYNGTMTVYWNGVADAAGAVSTSFNWPPVDQPWTWLQSSYLGNIAGSIKVKNVYFWNRALAQSDLQNIAAQYAGSSTSHYLPEPYSKN